MGVSFMLYTALCMFDIMNSGQGLILYPILTLNLNHPCVRHQQKD